MPPWDEVVRANSERPKGPALTQSPQREGGESCRQTNPIEFEARRTASSAILLLSDLFRKDFLRNAAVGAALHHCLRTTGFPLHRLRLVRTLKTRRQQCHKNHGA